MGEESALHLFITCPFIVWFDLNYLALKVGVLSFFNLIGWFVVDQETRSLPTSRASFGACQKTAEHLSVMDNEGIANERFS